LLTIRTYASHTGTLKKKTAGYEHEAVRLTIRYVYLDGQRLPVLWPATAEPLAHDFDAASALYASHIRIYAPCSWSFGPIHHKSDFGPNHHLMLRSKVRRR
jgi:hypothetical protein